MTTTVIMACACKNAFQDKEHGPNQRVFNECKAAASTRMARCTVCLNIKPISKDARG